MLHTFITLRGHSEEQLSGPPFGGKQNKEKGSITAQYKNHNGNIMILTVPLYQDKDASQSSLDS